MADVTITLTGANGDSIVLGTDANEEDYILGQSVSGFGLTGLSVNFAEGAGDGGKYLSSRRLIREVDLPIYAIGVNRADVEDKLRRLGRLLSDRSGATTITATFTTIVDDEPVITEWYLEGYLVSGGNVTYGDDAGKDYALWTIQLSCPQPYWTNATPVTQTLTGTEIDDVVLTNNGDIETYIILDITGVITNIAFSNTYGNIEYDAAIGATETITINCEEATVKDDTGVNKYGNLGPLPKMIRIPRGVSTLTITGTGIDTAAEVTITFNERRELIF